MDTKIRTNRGDTDGTPVPNDFKILGWDGAGVVDSVGSHGTFFLRGHRTGHTVRHFWLRYPLALYFPSYFSTFLPLGPDFCLRSV